MTILKSVSFHIDPETIAIVAYMYHSGKGPGETSQYRTEGRLVKVAALQEEIKALQADADGTWSWPGLAEEGWPILSYNSQTTKAAGAKWLEGRLKKAGTFAAGLTVLNGYKPSDQIYKASREYALEYTIPGEVAGQTLNLKTIHGREMTAFDDSALARIEEIHSEFLNLKSAFFRKVKTTRRPKTVAKV